MVDRKSRVTQSSAPNHPLDDERVPQGETGRDRGRTTDIGGRAETGRDSSTPADQDIASNTADTSDAVDPNDSQVFTSEGR